MKFSYLLILPTAFALVACGANDEESGGTYSSPIPGAVVTNPPAPVVLPTPTPTPTDTPPTSDNGCPTNPSESYYFATASGTGPYKVSSGSYVSVGSFGGRTIHADQKLRVSVRPTGASSVGSTGGSHNYNKMGLRVSLVKDGVVLSTKSIGLTSGSNGLKTGITAGVNSDPSLLDFSDALQGSSTGYSIRIDEVMTNYACKTYCTKNYYDCRDFSEGGNYWCTAYPSQYKWNLDYNRQVYTCCALNVLNECNNLKCGVGYDANNASWSVEVRVETDNTSCIPH